MPPVYRAGSNRVKATVRGSGYYFIGESSPTTDKCIALMRNLIGAQLSRL